MCNITVNTSNDIEEHDSKRSLLNQSAFLQQHFQVRSLEMLEQHLQQDLFLKGGGQIIHGLLVHRIIARTEEFTHIILGAPNLR